MKRILSLTLLIFLVGIIVSVSITQKNKKEILIKTISLEGNEHLTSSDYLNFASLNNKNDYRNLSIRIIKDRIEKHPYIKRADVKYDGSFKVSVKIYEKDFESILIDREKQYILTKDLELLPFLSGTKNINLPIISNVNRKDSLRVLSSLKNIYDVLTASKILSGIKFLSNELYEDISVLDMNYGNDIVIYFKSVDYPVIIGRGNEIKKVISYHILWEHLKGKEINNIINYVDLRYNAHIYLGIQDSLLAGEKKS